MSFLIIVLLFLLLIIFRILIPKGIFRNIIMLITFWWVSWLIISNLNFYNTFEVSIYAYSLIILFIVMFTIGYILSNSSKINLSTYNNTNYGIEEIFEKEILQSKSLKLFSFFIMLLLAFYFYKYRIALNTYGILESRSLRFSIGPVFRTVIEAHFFNYFITAFNYVNMAIVAMTINIKKVRNLNFFISFISVILFSGIGAGRNTLIGLGFFIIIIYLLLNHNIDLMKKVKKIRKKKSVFVLIISVITISIITLYTTAVRMGFKTINFEVINRVFDSLFEQIILYSTGAIRAFDYALKNFPFGNSPFWGRVTFGGLDQIVGSIFSYLGFDYKVVNYFISNISQDIILIGPTTQHNAHYTQLMAFYLDFGILGIIFFSFVLGFMTNKILRLYISKPSFPNLLMLLIIVDAMLRGLLNWRLGSVDILIVFLFILIWSSKIRIK